MKKKVNPQLLREELNKFKFLTEYAFYNEKEGVPEYKELLLGNELEEEEEEMTDDNVDASQTDIANDLGIPSGDEAPADGSAPPEGDIPAPDAGATPPPAPAPVPPPAPEPAPEDDDIEIDVTSLVKGSKEAKHSADLAGHNSEIILKQLSDLEDRLNSMSRISNQIEDLEKEIVKRAPTPNEKLEMQSVVSGPYTQKLSDYWADKEGAYDVMNNNQKKEYTLTKDDVDSGYSDTNIRKSFDINDDYDEEDI